MVLAVLFAGMIVAEIMWLVRSGWTTPGRAITFVFLTNFVSLSVASFVSFVIFGVMFAMAWDGSLSSVPGNEITLWSALITAIVLPPLALMISKRAFLGLLSIRSGKAAWLYSLTATAIFFLIVLVPPILSTYLF
jgi:hypothetical protein